MTGGEVLVVVAAAALLTGSSRTGRKTVARAAYRVADHQQARRAARRLPRDSTVARRGPREWLTAARGAWKRRTTTTVRPVPVPRAADTPTVRITPAPALAPAQRPGPARHAPIRAPRAVSSRITDILDDLGGTMDDFRRIARTIDKAGEIEPKSLHGLLDVMTGLMTTVVAVSNLVGEVADYADQEMWVDPVAIGPLYELSGQMQTDTSKVREAMTKIRNLYPAQLKAEEEASDNKDGQRKSNGPRPLNPQLMATQ